MTEARAAAMEKLKTYYIKTDASVYTIATGSVHFFARLNFLRIYTKFAS